MKPLQRALAKITIDGRSFDSEVLMWADGKTMSTQRANGTEYFNLDQRLGPNAWTLGGRLVAITILEVKQ